MKRSTIYLLGGLGAAGIAYAAFGPKKSKSSGTRGAPPPPEPTGEIKWKDKDAPFRIAELAGKIEDQTGWLGLSEFLVAVALWESRGDSDVCNMQGGSCRPNNARGWFQLRPQSALGKSPIKLADKPDILFNEPWAVAMAAWYAYRLRTWGKSGVPVNWLAIRRGWALPSLVKDVNETKARSKVVRQNLELTFGSLGIPESFMYEPAIPPGFVWPGVEQVLEIVGAPPAAAVA